MATTDIERLVVQISADFKRFENAFDRANGTADRGFKKIERRAAQLDKRLSGLGSGLTRGLASAFAAIGGTAAFSSLSDGFTSIENSLKVAGLEGKALESVFNDLYNSAKRNSAPLKDLAGLFRAVSLAQGELGVTTQQIIGFTDTIALALKVSGKSSTEAAGALAQLGQSLGGTVVRAEEFNSILEGAPSILLAAAGGLKEAEGSISKLRKIMLDGKLSSEAFFAAIEAGRPILEDKAAGAVETLGQKFTNLQTDLIKVVGQFNKTHGAAEALGSGIDGVASLINSTSFAQFISEIAAIATAFKDALISMNGFLQAIPSFSGNANSMLDNLTNSNGGGTGPGGAAGRSGIAIATDAYDKYIEAQIKERQRIYDEVYADPTKFGPQRPAKPVFDDSRVNKQYPPSSVVVNRPPVVVKPVSLDDYATPIDPSKKTKKGGKSAKTGDEKYGETLEEARQRLENLRTETALQSTLNPLVNDYGEALTALKFKQDLLNDAKKNGVEITPELMATIDGLSTAYGQASVEAAKLAESQEKIKASSEEMVALGKDVTRGLVDGFIEGKSAAELFADALSKIGNKLLDLAFDSAFSTSGSGGFLANLFKGGGYANGGYTGDGNKNDPAGIVHKGEYVVPKSMVDKVGVNGIEAALGGGITAPSFSRMASPAAASPSLVFAPEIDARGADMAAVARIDASLAKLNREFEARVIKTNRTAGRSNVKI